MRIVLVNPPLSDRYIFNRDEPLHLEYLAAQVAGAHQVRILDALGLGMSVRETVERTVAARPGLVGISLGFTAAYRTVIEICVALRERLPGTTIMLGGNTATFLSQELASRPEVDAVAIGEADWTFRELVGALDDGRPWDGVAGLVYRQDGELRRTPERPLIGDLTALPFPARQLLPLRRYYCKVILAARGCPYGCIYCSTSAFWRRRFRSRPVDHILEEVRMVAADPAVDYFAFADDCFTLKAERVHRICEGIEGLGRKISWSCTGRIETVSRELLRRMGQSGCKAIFFGVESGSPGVLRVLGRRYGPDEVRRVYADCIAGGIRPSFSYIVGLPTETPADRQATYDLIGDLHGVENGVHMLTPFPGTPIALDPGKYGIRILPHSPADLDINTRSVIGTAHATPEETEDAFRKGLGYCFRSVRRARNYLAAQAAGNSL